MHTCGRLRTSLQLLAVVGVTLGVAPTRAWAEVQAEDIAFDSELRLLELNDYGTYQRYSITLTIDAGAAMLSMDKDGETATVAVPLDECQALWQRLLESGLETLPDATPEILFPDQSDFTVAFRAAGQEGGFHAYGVDNISDGRYRDVVEELLAVGNHYLEQSRQ